MRIDLHTHSNASDGTTPPAALPALAARAGLDVVALTDHDTVAGLPDAARAATAAGIEFVPGVEISCQWDDVEVHLLGYYIDPDHAPLAAELELIRNDRFHRAVRMVELCRAAGADITLTQVQDIAGAAAIGRPHIASALVAAGVVAEPRAAFTDEWIGDGGRADVPKHVLTTRRAITLVRAAGGVPVLAHPRSARRRGTITDDALAALTADGLAGFEADHPEHEPVVRSALHGLATELGVVATGSSDFHGDRKPVRLGDHTTSPAVFAALRDAR